MATTIRVNTKSGGAEGAKAALRASLQLLPGVVPEESATSLSRRGLFAAFLLL